MSEVNAIVATTREVGRDNVHVILMEEDHKSVVRLFIKWNRLEMLICTHEVDLESEVGKLIPQERILVTIQEVRSQIIPYTLPKNYSHYNLEHLLMKLIWEVRLQVPIPV